jgi:photosystem II stability/assembly factor-like uncharacterized protein
MVDQVAPTPPASWVPVTSNLAGLASECGNVNGVYIDPRKDRLITGIALQGLFQSTDGAQTWVSIGAAGDPIKNRTTSIVFDPSNASVFWESGIYGWETNTDGVFVTKNDGNSFQGYAALDAIQSHNDSIAIDFTDPDRKTLLSGGHEQKGVLFLSTDAGATWKDIGSSLPAGFGFCTTTLVLDAKTFLVGCEVSYSQASGGILRSTDGGSTWKAVSTTSVAGLPLWASDGTVYWAGEGGGIVASRDDGVTWSTFAMRSQAGTVRPLELPDGRIVSTQGSNVVVTADKGATWTPIGTPIPFTPVGLSYSPFRAAFYAYYFTCSGSNAVPADGIVRYGWSYR